MPVPTLPSRSISRDTTSSQTPDIDGRLVNRTSHPSLCRGFVLTASGSISSKNREAQALGVTVLPLRNPLPHRERTWTSTVERQGHDAEATKQSSQAPQQSTRSDKAADRHGGEGRLLCFSRDTRNSILVRSGSDRGGLVPAAVESL